MSSNSFKKLADFVTLIRGTTYKGDLVGKPGPALLGLGSIQPGGGFRDTDYKTYGGDCPQKLMLAPGELFASLKGATKDGKMIGSVARVPSFVPSGRLTQDTVKLEFLEQDKANQRYIYWLLRTPQYREYCAGRAMGSAVVALSRDDFLSYPIPTLTHDREKLVELLEGIEARIRLLRDTSTTLEGIAQTLFKSWFVDFEPVRAKAEGLEPEGMDTSIAALFPDSFEESELELVPKGWRTVKLGSVCDYLNRGLSPKYIDEGGVLVINQKCIRDFSVDYSKARRHDPAQRKIDGRLLCVGDVLVNSTGVGTLGRVAQVLELPERMIVDSHVTVVRPSASLNWPFLGQWMARKQPEIEAMGEGSTGQTELARSKLTELPILVPSAPLLTAFDGIIRPLKSRIAVNEGRVKTLTELRDTLLPRLSSGELCLSGSKASLENALSEAI